MNKVYWGDCRDSLRQIKDEGITVQTCVTSPPYYGLRDYGTATWIGGDVLCNHSISMPTKWNDPKRGQSILRPEVAHRGGSAANCHKCNATRIDAQIGLEDTPQEFIDNLVEVFACVWDVLADDGTLWVNLGDSYSNNSSQASNNGRAGFGNDRERVVNRIGNGYKQKDLMGMPWRLAFALQDFGWYLRQDIIWHKPNPMPESVTDRCTKSHEYIFLLTKNQKYYFDNNSIKELSTDSFEGKRGKLITRTKTQSAMTDRVFNYDYSEDSTRNKRDVWTVPVKPYSGSHFAVFPTELIEPMILAGSRVGDIVLDPFFGSGTTGQVSQALGRKWIGCELNKSYESLQNERVSQQGLELI
jgi:site-specific DNA-methyltransferase (cytosine-N4-specific)